MKRKYKKNILAEVLFLSGILALSAFPGNSINVWASEITTDVSVSGNDIVEPEAPETEPGNSEVVLDVSGNEEIVNDGTVSEEVPGADETISDDAVSEDAVSDNEATESNLIVQELALPVEDAAKEVFNIELPTLAENSIFNYILDPQGIVSATDAVMYGSVPFEEGATLFFENREGAFGLSSRSDMVEVKNKSTTAVKISVYAQVTPAEGVVMASDKDFEDESTSLYLALVAEDGTEIPIGTGEEAVLVKEMKAAPAGIYALEYNEEAGVYEYVLADEAKEDAFDSFSFGLTGACNPKGDWRFVRSTPGISVTWKVEPVAE